MNQEERQKELIELNAEWLYKDHYSYIPLTATIAFAALSEKVKNYWREKAIRQINSVLVPAGLGWMERVKHIKTENTFESAWTEEVFVPLTKQGEQRWQR